MNRTQIREIFLRNGFNIKPGCDDLKSYVYAAAEELFNLAEVERLSVVQGEPVAWIVRHPHFCGKFTDDKEIAEHWENKEQGCTAPLFLHPRPVPDIDALVAAMEKLLSAAITTGKMTDLNRWSMRSAIQDADTALCNYRKQGGEV